jgi:hypothetical protein
MEYEKEIIRELLSAIEILQQFYEPPEQIAPQFHSWILHVTDALEAAEMDRELKIWQRALETVKFYDDDSSLTVQMSSLKTVILGMQKKLDKSNGKDVVEISEPFIANERIRELSEISSTDYDLTKLIELCKELNYVYAGGCYLAVAMLTRAILDHVPPIFGLSKFSEIANNYKGSKSFKESMSYLENSSRKIADSFLHTQIRNSETLPTQNQLKFSADLDVLLSEIVRVLKSKSA